MKKLISAFAFLCLFAAPLLASYPYEFTISDEDEIVSDDTYSYDLMTGRIIDYLSCQAIYSTKTYTAVSFTDGTRSANSIIVSSAAYRVMGTTITINGTNIVEGNDWNLNLDFSTQTARNISLAIQAKTALQSIILSTAPTDSTVCASTAIYEGQNYVCSYSGNASDIVVNSFTGGVASDISASLDRVTKTNDWITGLAVLLSTTAGTVPTGLANDTVYYAIPTATYFSLASTKANALAGTAINISSLTYATGGAFTLTPQGASDGTLPFSFKWQVSDDKSNWYDISATSVTILSTTTPTNYLWDFGFTAYRYIRAKLTAGTYGAIKLKFIGYGKRVAP